MREQSAKWQEIWKREGEAVRASLQQAQDSSTLSGKRLVVRLAEKSMELSKQKRETEETKRAYATALSVAEQEALVAKAEQTELERIANDLRAELNEQEEARFVEQGIANEACRGLKSEKEERQHAQEQWRLAQREVERLNKVVVRLERERKVSDSRHMQQMERYSRILASKNKELEVNGKSSPGRQRRRSCDVRHTTERSDVAQNCGDEDADSFSGSREAAKASLTSLESSEDHKEESHDEDLSLDESADMAVCFENANEAASAASLGESLSRSGYTDSSGTSLAHTSAYSENSSYGKTRTVLKEHVTLSLALIKTKGEHHGLKSLAELRIGSRLPILSRHAVLAE
ncbi:hypothetical protein CBOM_01065 [Ceraceosorus bombacis]|uniref:Uncharacterized protein n=1 Tax=Ceraceosorus bombacis TaxID=401625 RepID=A0A0P1BAW3_9BASI|nr:hypothetical protein CBOM_01065 [Ceraceosorus bombacis]